MSHTGVAFGMFPVIADFNLFCVEPARFSELRLGRDTDARRADTNAVDPLAARLIGCPFHFGKLVWSQETCHPSELCSPLVSGLRTCFSWRAVRRFVTTCCTLATSSFLANQQHKNFSFVIETHDHYASFGKYCCRSCHPRTTSWLHYTD